MVVGEAVAESLQEASGYEENGFVVFDRRLEDMIDVEDTKRLMELEKAGVLAVKNVVESGEIGAETFSESLSR